jgi:lipoprotein-releasing system ATP-binding protein
MIDLSGINKSYGTAIKTHVLKNISLSIEKGELCAIIGQSGSGKSTLLNILGLLDVANSGTFLYENQDTGKMSDDQRAHFRNSVFGFIFQFHHLLPEFTALENVLIPWQIANGSITLKAKEHAKELLERAGVSKEMNNRSTNLSGGQQQRVAIARALINNPQVVFADEPTGNLDSDTAQTIFELMKEINRTLGSAFIVVSHDRHLAAECSRVIEIADGVIKDDIRLDLKNKVERWNVLSPCYCRMKPMISSVP